MAQQIWHNQTQKKVKIHKNLRYLGLILPI